MSRERTDDRPRVLLVRLSGEIATKAPATRARFEARLGRNLADALRCEGIPARITRTRNRLFVDGASDAAASVAARVFGVQSVSLAVSGDGTSLDEVVRSGEDLFRDSVAGKRFAVRVRRVGERRKIPLVAREVERELGTALLRYAARVDLDAPEATARIELHDGDAYFFTERLAGPGGLPLGIEGRAVALVSGGFDSPVAAWQLARRGVALDYVFCNLGGEAHRLGVLRVLKVLADRWSYGDRPRLHVIDFDGVTRELRERTPTRYWQVLLKRLMLHGAEAVARERRGMAIVTGESVGQVSSQTLPNLAVISEATALPILRPLAGANKTEIIEQAERIGTAALSAVVGEYCALVPRRPATQASLDVVRSQEAKLDPSGLEKAIVERAVFDLRALDPDAQGIPAVDVTEVPTGATVIDLRSRAAYESWCYPDALHLEFGRALTAYPSFSRDPTYVLYCEFGLKSAHLAELMQREGFQAFHFKGGLRPLLRYARERNLAAPDLLDPAGLAQS